MQKIEFRVGERKDRLSVTELRPIRSPCETGPAEARARRSARRLALLLMLGSSLFMLAVVTAAVWLIARWVL